MTATAQEPETLRISEVRTQLNQLVNTIYRDHARFVVQKSGIPVAALISIDDLKRLERLDREREARFAVIDEVREVFRDVPADEIERETDRILDSEAAPARPSTEPAQH